ncbi:hypothetical protein CKO35_02305 [Ectothiorhodospira shaposhnikovii]|uniref:gamma-glutamylcyclotransferase family protein n=1 Tax=Ectothiorhodospira shaposhnikovii TaxID=1054 RepID=UPI0019032DF0|nr:gamma-glutamylcyclotransferase family protein [Ectothiorhodospira shaposhnikovii]MBK1672149.1 hypothetical protein [Ectothiorhodospira shaposhnikovii]
MNTLFAYGTLMFDDVMGKVSGSVPPGEPARLRGFRRGKVQGECFPAIVPGREGVVEGWLYRGLTSRDWRRLDRFEGDFYERRRVRVELRGGRTLPAFTYVLRPVFGHRLTAEDWESGGFGSDDRRRLLGVCRTHRGDRDRHG